MESGPSVEDGKLCFVELELSVLSGLRWHQTSKVYKYVYIYM